MRLNKVVAINLAALLCSPCAYADPMVVPATTVYDGEPKEGLHIALDQSLSSDSNVFRLPDGVYSPGSTKRSDTINTQQVDLKYDKTYGLQNFVFDGTVSHNQFSNFSFLNYDAKIYKGAWNWKIDKDFSGSLGAEQDQSLVNFAMFQSFVKNLVTTQSRYFNGDWWMTGPWHALFGVSSNQTKYSVPFFEQQNQSGNSTEAGISYVTEAQNTISLKARNTRGVFSGIQANTVLAGGLLINSYAFVDNSTTQKDEELDVNWTLSGKSTLTGQLKHFALAYDYFSQRNYGGVSGNLNYLWAVSGKTVVNFTAQRNYAQFQTAGSSYYVNDDFAISPAWLVSPKLTLRMALDRSNYDFLGAITSGTAYGRKDVMQTVMVAADWAPTRAITLSTSLQHSTRSSNLDFQFGDNTLNVIAQFSF